MNRQKKNMEYYIQQVSEMTGLSRQVIRKWEERHAVVQPKRLPNGYRVYNEHDINTLLHVKALSEQGYSISRAVEQVNKQLIEQQDMALIEHVTINEPLNKYVFQLLEKGAACDELELNLVLQRAYHEYSLRTFLADVVEPFLIEIGLRWERGVWDEYQESVSSLAVRDYLVQIRRGFKHKKDAPLVIGACLPYEVHEIPVHIILLEFMLRGYRTILAGASPAVGSIQSLVQRLKPSIVLLSATTTKPFEEDSEVIVALNRFATQNKDIQFYLGGPGSSSYFKDRKLSSIKIVQSVQEIR